MAALVHKPLRPARANHNGEQVYSSMWLAMMAETWEEGDDDAPTPLDLILKELPCKVGQRHATVAATLACWLGCNMGNALMHRARAEIHAGRWDRDRAYLLAWTLENRRSRGVNHGVRLIEYMLTPTEDWSASGPFDMMHSGIARMPMLSADDLEVVDHLMLWLPTWRGEAFVRQCDREIDRLRDEEQRRQTAEFHRRQEFAP